MSNVIVRGDCVFGMSVMPEGSVHLVFADPPFNIGFEYDQHKDNMPKPDYLAWSRSWMTEVRQVLTADGTFWLAIGDEYVAELAVLAKDLGFYQRSWVIWYYTFGVNCRNGFSRSHTHLLHFVKNPAHFTFNSNDPANRVPSARSQCGDKRADPSGRLPDNTWVLRPQELEAEGGFVDLDDVWHVPRVAGTFKERRGFHGCQMPERVMERIIGLCSRPGETVLDPFAGTGTTLAVADRMGRNSIGFELSETYVAGIRERVTC